MIHQLIFAAPKPGMTEREFQDYWLDVHAVQYASKIPQIRKYAIDTRIPSVLDGEGEPLWSGVAEIWLANEQEQLASLQTDEFLNGARLDEPRWAAFWRSVVLDTDAHVVKEPPRHEGVGSGVKLLRLVKRAEGLPLDAFRERSLSSYASRLAKVPGLRGYLQNHTRDGYYALGEAMLDAVHLMWFDDEQSLAAALESAEFKHAEEELAGLIEPRYDHRLVTREHWIIGPDAR